MTPLMPNPVNSAPDSGAQFFKLELDTLFQISHILSRSLDLQEILQEVLEVLDEQAGIQQPTQWL